MSRLMVREFATGYGLATVVSGVNLTVPAGAIHAVLGPNGAGKTALLHGVVGLLPSVTGEIFVDGSVVTAMAAYRRARLGVRFVPQGARLFGRLTVADHLRLASRSNRAAVAEILDRLPALTARLRHRPDHLSGGEAAMLSLARALLSRPRLLVLDEPTDGLAPAVAAAVHELVSDAARAGAGVLISASRVAHVHPSASRFTHLRHGRVVAAGTQNQPRFDRMPPAARWTDLLNGSALKGSHHDDVRVQ